MELDGGQSDAQIGILPEICVAAFAENRRLSLVTGCNPKPYKAPGRKSLPQLEDVVPLLGVAFVALRLNHRLGQRKAGQAQAIQTLSQTRCSGYRVFLMLESFSYSICYPCPGFEILGEGILSMMMPLLLIASSRLLDKKIGRQTDR